MSFNDDMAAATADIIEAIGEKVTFQGDLETTTIRVDFYENAPIVNDDTGEVISEGPLMMAKTSDMARVKTHDKVTVGLKTYKVVAINHDGTGGSKILLRKIRDDG